MQTIRVVEKTDKDGTLLLRIPLGKPETEYDVLLVLQPKKVPSQAACRRGTRLASGLFRVDFWLD